MAEESREQEDKQDPSQVNVLFVEDEQDDVELSLRELRSSGLDPFWRRVENEEDLVAALGERFWQVAIVDFKLPRFGGARALEILAERSPETAPIVVSGVLGEVAAVEMMRIGARDYVLKDNLTRLSAAVLREIDEVEAHHLRDEAERALEVSEARFHALVESAPVGVFLFDSRGSCSYANPALLAMLGRAGDEVLGDAWKTCAPDLAADSTPSGDAATAPVCGAFDDCRCVLRGDGEMRLLQVSHRVTPGSEPEAQGTVGVALDITAREVHLLESDLAGVFARLFLEPVSTTELYHAVAAAAAAVLHYPRAVVELLEVVDGTMMVAGCHGIECRCAAGDRRAASTTLAGRAVRERRVIVQRAGESTPSESPAASSAGAGHDQADATTICVPLSLHGSVLGALSLADVGPRPDVDLTAMVLERAAVHLGRALESAVATSALHESMRRYEDLFHNSTDAILLADLEGEILEANEAAGDLHGLERRDLTAMRFGRLISAGTSEDGDGFERLRARLLAGETVADRGLALRADGGSIAVDLRLRAVRRGGQVAIMSVARDMRDSIEAEARLAESNRRLTGLVEGVTEAMGLVVEMRDRHISGHQRRVTALAGAIADELGLDEPTCAGLRLAAAVHDIGTIAVPVEIIGRPARLTDVELGFVRVHPEVGRDILQSISFDAPVAEIVAQHHERLDGSGYPAGLRGRQILIEARIIAVADVVEAMSSHRPWRAALPMQVALDEVRAGRDRLFDANVVDACLTVIHDRGFEFRI